MTEKKWAKFGPFFCCRNQVEQFVTAALKAGIIANEIFENEASVIHVMNTIGSTNGSEHSKK